MGRAGKTISVDFPFNFLGEICTASCFGGYVCRHTQTHVRHARFISSTTRVRRDVLVCVCVLIVFFPEALFLANVHANTAPVHLEPGSPALDHYNLRHVAQHVLSIER